MPIARRNNLELFDTVRVLSTTGKYLKGLIGMSGRVTQIFGEPMVYFQVSFNPTDSIDYTKANFFFDELKLLARGRREQKLKEQSLCVGSEVKVGRYFPAQRRLFNVFGRTGIVSRIKDPNDGDYLFRKRYWVRFVNPPRGVKFTPYFPFYYHDIELIS